MALQLLDRATNTHCRMDDELRTKVEDAQVEGWKIDSETDRRVVMVKRNYGTLGGHVLVFLLTFWTFGLGNVLYAAYKYFKDADRKVLREEDSRGGAGSAE